MLRELADTVESLARLRPLLLVLEDLQWSDPSTLDALAFLSSRRDPTRVTVVATFRPEALPAHVRAMLDRLREKGAVEELFVSHVEEAATGEPTAPSSSDDRVRARVANAPFVGRSAEQGRLVRRFEVCRSGSGGLVLVSGEPGIGKTRLLGEVASWATAAGARVL